MSTLAAEITTTLHDVLGSGPVPLHAPVFAGNEHWYTADVIDSTFVSSVGPYVNRFEQELAAVTGAKFAVCTVNGTSALHLALLVAGVQPGDEVLIPALSFVATANAVAYCQATAHFVDSSPLTLGIDPEALRSWLQATTSCEFGITINRRTGRPIRAIIPMHTFGHPCEIDAIMQIAEQFNLTVVEDAAESLGSSLNRHHTGTTGALGALSFNGNKIITTGGGGAILTNDPVLAQRAQYLSTTAKTAHKWAFEHDEIGYNYRMPNINAALGCAQLEQLPEFLTSKRQLFDIYAEAFAEVEHCEVFREPAGAISNYWLQVLLLDEQFANHRDDVLEATNDAGFQTRPAWNLLNGLKPYLGCPRAPLPNAESLERRIICIPSSAGLA